MRQHTFTPGEVVVFKTFVGGQPVPEVDTGQHVVDSVEEIPDTTVRRVDSSNGRKGRYVKERTLAGHHQFVTLKNGRRVSGFYLKPVPKSTA